MSNLVTVSKTPDLDWNDIKDELRTFIQKDLMGSQLAVQKVPAKGNSSKNNEKEEIDFSSVPSEFDEKIQSILEEYVRPAVERDGGAIDYKSFVNGTVTVVLKGSCSGCPSSTVTLKNGVESLLQSMIPQVREVVAFEM
jgi:Fe-S cluster biogenesis protein NfuA